MKDKSDLISLDDARLSIIHKINNNETHNKDMSLKMLKRIEEMMIDACVKYLVSDFINYWTEKNKSETKMKWEMQQTFQISRRLLTWKKNNEKRDMKKKASSFESKFRKTSAGYYVAYCSKCGNREFPNDKWQLKDGSYCCKVEYLPKEKTV